MGSARIWIRFSILHADTICWLLKTPRRRTAHSTKDVTQEALVTLPASASILPKTSALTGRAGPLSQPMTSTQELSESCAIKGRVRDIITLSLDITIVWTDFKAQCCGSSSAISIVGTRRGASTQQIIADG